MNQEAKDQYAIERDREERKEFTLSVALQDDIGVPVAWRIRHRCKPGVGGSTEWSSWEYGEKQMNPRSNFLEFEIEPVYSVSTLTAFSERAERAEIGEASGKDAHLSIIKEKNAELSRLTALLEEAACLLRVVPGSLHQYFYAGIEEREGGSARRQEKIMAGGEALIADIRIFLARIGQKGSGHE